MIPRYKSVIFSLLIIVIGTISSIPTTKALNLTYNDGTTNLTITGPDVTRGGITESYTVSGQLLIHAQTRIHITLSLDTSSQLSKVILEDDTMPNGTYDAGFTFTKPYHVFIPTDAKNNTYIYAKIETLSMNFSSGVSLIQYPTYNDLRYQIASLQSQVNNLQTNKTGLQAQVDTLQRDKANLQAQVTSLQTDKAILQSQISNLQVQVGSLQMNNTNLTTQVTNFQAQVNSLQTDKANLQTQINAFQSELATTNNMLIAAAAIAIVFVTTTIYFVIRLRAKKGTASLTPSQG